MTTSIITDEWRTGALYTIREAANLVGVAPITIRRWLYGYESDGRLRYPIFGHPPEDVSVPVVSFLVLAELVVYQAFRTRRLKAALIERAYRRAKMRLLVDYPFATLKLESLGGHILFEEEDEVRVLDQPEMRPLPGIVLETLHNFDYEDELAARWFPLGRSIPVVVDPRYSAGIPTIKDRRVSAQVILKRFHNAKQSIAFIAKDLSLEPAIVEVVIQNENLIPV